MVAAADDNVTDEEVNVIERSACPTCGSCSGMFTANSMNCLTEALGLALPGNGTTLATHADRKRLFVEAGHLIVDLARRYYEQDDASVLPRAIASFAGLRERHDARHRDGRLDQHGAASAGGGARRRDPLHHGGYRPAVAPRAQCCARSRRPRATSIWRTCIAPAASWRSSANSTAPGCSIPSAGSVHAESLGAALDRWDVKRTDERERAAVLPRGARRRADAGRLQPGAALRGARPRPRGRRHPRRGACVQPGRRPRGALRQPRRGRLHREDGGRRSVHPGVQPAPRASSRARMSSVDAILGGKVKAGRRRADPLRGAARRPGHAGDALSDELPEIEGPRKALRAGHRRPLLGRHLGPVDRPRVAGSRRGRHHRPGATRATGSRSTSRTAASTSRCRTPSWPSGARPSSSAGKGAFRPAELRKRKVTTALRAYAALTTSAARGAVRVVPE